MTEKDFDAIGIETFGARRRLQQAIHGGWQTISKAI